VKNPRPIKRALRVERRRLELGSNNPQCFYCGESDIACLELDHPVTRGLDPVFKRVVCRNCHRKLEIRRDVSGLTKNGQHDTTRSEGEARCDYLLLLAEDQDSIAELLLSTTASPESIAAALRSTAASMRRKARPQSQMGITSPVRRPRRYRTTETSNPAHDQAQPHAAPQRDIVQ
jgi:hypothetical protein